MGNYFWYDRTNSITPRTCGAGLRVPRRVYEFPKINRHQGASSMTPLSELPINEKKGFLANYARQLGLSAACLIITGVVVVLGHMENAPPTLAFAALPLLFFSIVCLVWPFHCYFQHRALMSIASPTQTASERRSSYIY